MNRPTDRLTTWVTFSGDRSCCLTSDRCSKRRRWVCAIEDGDSVWEGNGATMDGAIIRALEAFDQEPTKEPSDAQD